MDSKIPITEIGFDFDGVIADTADAFIRIACQQHSYCSFTIDDITNFDLENCINVPRNLVEKIFTDILLDSLGTDLQPMPGAIDALELFASNSPVTIITARPVKQPVYDWIDRFFSGPASQRITVITTGDHNDKVRHIHACGLKYFIDDRAETCLQLVQENITPFVFNQPWNRDRHNLSTIDSWQSIQAMIEF